MPDGLGGFFTTFTLDLPKDCYFFAFAWNADGNQGETDEGARPAGTPVVVAWNPNFISEPGQDAWVKVQFTFPDSECEAFDSPDSDHEPASL